MYSTTTIVKSSRFTGRIIGTHQQLDIAARKLIKPHLHGHYFPSAKEIIHFEGTRGPDGLKRKSPGQDDPSHMLVDQKGDRELAALIRPSNESGHEQLDERSVLTIIQDHHYNLIKALSEKNHVRAAFESAWMAHMITDGLTPAHHYPLSKVKDQLMTDKEVFRVFGQPIKGMMHGRSLLETMRNNWLYWGAKGPMSQHIAFEYGTLMIAAALPRRAIMPKIDPNEFVNVKLEDIFDQSLKKIQRLGMYDRFITEGWTTELAFETKDILFPEIIKAITLSWYAAAEKAYHLRPTGMHGNAPIKI